MWRSAILASIALGFCASAVAQERETQSERPEQRLSSDGFVISGDACGASRYEHLIGEDYATVLQASLMPAGNTEANRSTLTRLIYHPERLNVRLSADGRILSIGCF